MADSAEHLARRLHEDGEKTLAFFDGLAPGQWELLVYTDGAQWTIRQLLSHLTTSEMSLGRLVENILAGGQGSPEDFDIDRYNARKVAQMEGTSSIVLKDLYRQARSNNISLVSSLSLDDLERVGRHPFLGVTTLSEIIKVIYRHNQIHLRDVRKVLG
jgi:hypothetical protein